MSENKENKGTGNALVDAILKILKLDEAGQVSKFINKTIKGLERDVVTYDRKIVNLEHNAEGDMSALEEQLEDLKEAFSASHTAITIDDIKTNEAANDFRPRYLANIRRCEVAVEAKEQEIADLKESLEESKKVVQDKINMRKTRIKALRGK